MNRLKAYTNDWEYADYLIAVQLLVFPWFSRLMPLLVTALVVGVFFSRGEFKRQHLSWKKPTIWLLILFFVHLVGMLWTENQMEGWNDIGMKLSLLVIPLSLLIVKTKMRRVQFADMLIAGLVLSCAVNYAYAIFKSIYHQEDNHWAYFTESYFSFNMHRSYYAIYIVIGVIVAMQRYYQSRKIAYLFAVLVFSAVTLQTFSKVGIILLVLVAFPVGIYYFVKIFGWLKAGIVALALVVLGSVVFLKSDKMQVRFTKMIQAATGESTSAVGTIESNSTRVIMWETSLDLFGEAPILGAGTGDVMDVISSRNIRNGDILLAKKHLNSHNQYLNTAVQLGILGLLPLVFLFLAGIFQSLRQRDLVFFSTVLILGISLFFESSLERQDGVIPISLLIVCLSFIPPIIEASNRFSEG